ncbi:MAG: ATP-binding protein, partial [Duncaniella sp.]|nr:ATP-binding protein [Duncaniella sp.]
MERRNMKISVRRTDILPIIREVAEVQQMRGEKEIRIRVETSEKEIIAEVDKSHLTNVLNNLVDNAIKYSGDEVEIVISCDRGRIVVSDNGIGIPSKNLPYIFDKFYRVPHGNRQDIRGYGIGLYYVRQTIEQMGGTISVESTSGKGSRFTITLN